MVRPRRDGVGADARASRMGRRGVPRGGRFLLRFTPDDAIRLAADELVVQGFVPRDDGFDVRLRALGSMWQAVSLEIGDAKLSNRSAWWGLVLDELPFPLPRALRHGIPPTLVVVSARRTENGVTELVVYPHTSRSGDPEYAFAASPRVEAAMREVAAAAAASGALIEYAIRFGIPNDGCPASQQMVRDVLGWR